MLTGAVRFREGTPWSKRTRKTAVRRGDGLGPTSCLSLFAGSYVFALLRCIESRSLSSGNVVEPEREK